VCDAGFDELELYSADATVIHVGGSDIMGASFSVGHDNIRNALDGHCVAEGAIVAQDVAVAV
jgi:hypothetical protein